MTIIISTQNHLICQGGINKFIIDYSSKLSKHQFITRDNPRLPHKINGDVNILKILKKINPSEVHIHSVLDSTRYHGLINLFKMNKFKVVYYCHSLINEEIEHSDEKNIYHQEKLLGQEELFEKADKVIFFNNWQRNECIKKYPYITTKSIVKYHTTDKTFSKKIKTDKINILYVGRLSLEKGILDLVNAYVQIENTQTNLMIIGALPGDSILPQIIQSLKGTNYNIINWKNSKKELEKYYNLASLVVLPSHYDSFNMVGIESLKHGIPLLVSDIPVFKEIYSKKENVHQFKSKSSSDLSKKLKIFLNKLN